MEGTEKPKRNIRSKIVIHWNHDKSKWWFQLEDKEGIMLVSHEFDTEKECRERIARVKRLFKIRMLKVEIYDGQ